MNDEKPLLTIDNLAVSFMTGGAGVQAVNGAAMTVYPRQTLAVVGESGSGKSVTALSTLKLIPTPPGRYESGRICFAGQNLLDFSERQMQRIRGNDIAMIFQEPMTSLNPVYTVGDQILEAIFLHQKVNKAQALSIATDALDAVGVAEPRQRLDEYPHQMSGGMRQRIMIAMALACQPRLLLADEPTTALDVTIQAQILELLRQLQNERDMAIMLITHDLGVVAENADVVAVMYAGRIVEYGTVHDIFDHPLHPYTLGLLKSMPRLGEGRHRLQTVLDITPDSSILPDGLTFQPPDAAPRRPIEQFPILSTLVEGRDKPMVRFLFDTAMRAPQLRELKPDHWVACWHEDRYDDRPPIRPDLAYRRQVAPAVG